MYGFWDETLAGSPCRRWAYRDSQWSRMAALVPVVKACAAGGDGEALRVLREGIAELALSVKAVAAALQLGATGGVKGTSRSGGSCCIGYDEVANQGRK